MPEPLRKNPVVCRKQSNEFKDAVWAGKQDNVGKAEQAAEENAA